MTFFQLAGRREVVITSNLATAHIVEVSSGLRKCGPKPMLSNMMPNYLTIPHSNDNELKSLMGLSQMPQVQPGIRLNIWKFRATGSH